MKQVGADLGKPQDWQQALGIMLCLLQNQQVQMEELVRVRAQEAEAQILILSWQQELSEK